MIAVAALLSFLLFVSGTPSTPLALERHIHAGAGGSSPQELPLFVAKDLGIFQKYGLDVDLVVIGGGFAGVAAARDAHHNGREVLLLEARDRLGNIVPRRIGRAERPAPLRARW